jgi:hypothetical protein
MFAACIFGISASTADLSALVSAPLSGAAANAAPGSAATAAAAAEALTNSRLLKISLVSVMGISSVLFALLEGESHSRTISTMH